MQLVLASNNSGKIREFKQLLDGDIKAFSEIIPSFEIIEYGDTFAENALIKARAIYEKLGEDHLVISDDSGITVPLLGGVPDIYSARYVGEDATAQQNLDKLILEVGKQTDRTPAYYTAAIAIVSKYGEYVVHGWMHGDVIAEARGSNGFGYDPMFIPEGYAQTLAELGDEVKAGISHRHKALALAVPIIEMLEKKI